MEFELLVAEVWNNINYGSNHDEPLKSVNNELISNSDDTKGQEYKSSDFEKTDYRDNNKIVNAIWETYPENLNEYSNDTTSMADFNMLRSCLPVDLKSESFLMSTIN